MENKHFSDEQVALCAEALNKGNVESLPAYMQKHLSECNDCASSVTMVAELSENIALESDTGGKSGKLSLLYRISAAAVILILIGLGFYKGKPSINDNNVAQTNSDTLIVINKSEEYIASDVKNIESNNISDTETVKKQDHIQPAKRDNELLAYATNADLEKLVDRFKTGAMRGDEVEVLSPVVIEGKIGEVVLEWTNTDAQELIVEFFNNNGEKLFEEVLTVSSIKPEKLTNKGLYYWKLINEDFDLVFCGKIKLQ